RQETPAHQLKNRDLSLLFLVMGIKRTGEQSLTDGGAVFNCRKRQTGALEKTILSHMDPVNNLARWLTRNDHNAEDMVQEAYFRECKLFDGSHGTDTRASLKLKEKDKLARFEQSILPHMDAAYNLAR